ncbi:aspartyl/asparaginyl beta-hydroxylase domain-containing protein [Sphingomonas oryzagri]
MKQVDPDRRPFVIRQGRKIRHSVDAIIARSSLVPNDPVLDPSLFDWIPRVQAVWQEIRMEALYVTRHLASVPALRAISPDHHRIAVDDRWRSFFLVGYGQRIERNLEQCPATAAALSLVPGLNSGFFSILTPGTHIPRHRGVTKGLITCHIGLSVPPAPGLRMEIGGREVGWAEGEPLVFDDTWHHEVWNDSASPRIVLLIQFERPLRQPGKAISRAFLAGIRRTSFVREARANLDRYSDAP